MAALLVGLETTVLRAKAHAQAHLFVLLLVSLQLELEQAVVIGCLASLHATMWAVSCQDHWASIGISRLSCSEFMLVVSLALLGWYLIMLTLMN